MLSAVFLFGINGLKAGGNEEFRAVWVITWEHINRDLSAEQNKANIREILDNVKKAHMNAVLWQVRQGGTVYYNSSYEPWGRYAGYQDPGYDPLAYAIQEAHKRGLELHAWFNTFNISDTSPGTPAAEHPEWICTNEDGQTMTSYRSASPGLQAVRDYTVKVAMEIVRNYDIDGFHLDYIRWNEYDEDDMKNAPVLEDQLRRLDGTFSDERLQKLAKGAGTKRYIYDVEHPAGPTPPEGYATWDDWRRASVTTFVQQLHDSIQAVKPWVRLSPAALGKYNWSGWNGYEIVFQDAALWYNQGYIDQLMLMSYHWTTSEGFKGMLETDCPDCWKDYTTEGRNAGRLFTPGPGSYVLDDYNVWDNHPAIVNACRDVSFVDGFQFFSYGSWENYDYWETAGQSFFATPTRIRPLTYMSTDIPDAPSVALTKTGVLSYKLDIAVPNSDKARYAIYRTTSGGSDVDTDEILDIVYADSAFSYVDELSGTQDYNGVYHYYVTTLNRYWNQSAPSALVAGDSVLSLPPTVVGTTPAENGEITIGSGIRIDFSKTMDSREPDSMLHFDPDVAFDAQWNEDYKSLSVTFPNLLAKSTYYTVTIDSVLQDVNGKMLDGNADSTGGDSYVFHFYTRGDDDVPPVISAFFPQNTASAEVEDVFNFWFNEPLLEDSLNSDQMALYQGNTLIDTKYFYRKQGEQSSLTIQSTEPLQPSTDYTLFLSGDIVDTSGNALGETVVKYIKTSPLHYADKMMIDNFSSTGGWWDPSGSGSTTGILGSKTVWGISKKAYLPVPSLKRSAYLKYAWDVTANTHLIREYLPPTEDKNIEFDSTYTMQVYIYGDGSGTLFRFAVDEFYDGGWKDTEVSLWVTVDWIGWKLVEWKLSEPGSVGSWISPNEAITGEKFRTDSFQFGYVPGVSAESGLIYLDEYRLVKKSDGPVGIGREDAVPLDYVLEQNYPNPFNPQTTIRYALPHAGHVKIIVYNMQGRRVTTLVDAVRSAGTHQVQWDGAHMASGSYIYRLETPDRVISKKMVLVK